MCVWERERDEHDLEPLMSFVKDDGIYKTVKSFFYVHRIGKHDKQKILNLELVLFHLKHTISKPTVINHRFLRKGKLMCLQVLMLLHLFRIRLHLRQKCKFLIFFPPPSCAWDTHNAFHTTTIFPAFMFVSRVPWEMTYQGYI